MKAVRLVVASLLLAVLPSLASAQGLLERFRAGEHYSPIAKPQAMDDAKGIEVVEVFNHGCIHCFHFEPALKPWHDKLPADVRFVYLPAPFRPDFALISRAYFAAQELGVAEKNHQSLYDYIWTDKKPVATLDQLADFYAAHGADRAEFLKIASGDKATAHLERTMQLLQAWEIDGTPSIVVAGKYRVVPGAVGSPALALEVVDYLIAKERGTPAR